MPLFVGFNPWISLPIFSSAFVWKGQKIGARQSNPPDQIGARGFRYLHKICADFALSETGFARFSAIPKNCIFLSIFCLSQAFSEPV